ncbi:MAG: RnfABCDGE type electron transport complex subunit D [Mycoplasmatales bacterium]
MNPKVEDSFSYKPTWVMEDIEPTLLIIALISILMNTLASPVLGIKALLIFIVAYLTPRLTEAIYLMFAKEITYTEAISQIKESCPQVIGLIFALLIPIGTPLYSVVISLALAVIIARVAFGGFTYNLFNVPVVAAVICYISWPSISPLLSSNYWLDYILIQISNLIDKPLDGFFAIPDVVTTSVLPNAGDILPTWFFFTNSPQVYLGLIPSIIIILLAIRLMYGQVIGYKVPLMISILTIIGTIIVCMSYLNYDFITALLYSFNALFGTILIFVILFVANDPVTMPNSTKTQFIYSLIIVTITLFIRFISTNIEGVLFAILFANMLVPLLNAKSNIFSNTKKRVYLILSCILFILTMFFIGYNTTEEPITYSTYKSIFSTEPVCTTKEPTADAEASASVPAEETKAPEVDPACNQQVPNNETPDVDEETSASVE